MPNIKRGMMGAAGAGGAGGYQLWGAGNNSDGALATGETTNRSSPVQIVDADDWVFVTSNRTRMHGIRSDGTLWGWGGQNGRIGSDTTIDYSSPVQIGSLSTWDSVWAGPASMHATKTDGTMWTCGSNTSYPYLGTLGLSAIRYSSPIQMGALTDWGDVQLSNSGGMLAVKSNGTLWSWGDNREGELGTDDKNSYPNAYVRSSPTQVGELTDWVAVAGTRTHGVAAIKTDGTLWAWGNGEYNQTGHGDTVDRSSPVQVGSVSTWARVIGLKKGFLAIRTNGTLWGWGGNTDGELGTSDVVTKTTPTQIGSLTNWSTFSSGNRFSTAVKTDGTLWAWGRNTSGYLGQNNTISYSSPVQVGSDTDWIYVPNDLSDRWGITSRNGEGGIKAFKAK